MTQKSHTPSDSTTAASAIAGLGEGPGVTSLFDLPTTQAISLFWLAVIGLGLNEAAYMVEARRGHMPGRTIRLG